MEKKVTSSVKRTSLREVNPHLICPMCRGYFIDATTVVECLHSFCRSCILKHLRHNAHCPSCKHLVNTAKPNIKADKTLQDIVYKLVPGLYHKEMRKRREFYSKHPEDADATTPEQRGEDVTGRLIFAPEDAISLSLEYLPPGADPLQLLSNTTATQSTKSEATLAVPASVAAIDKSKATMEQQKLGSVDISSKRYLQCPAMVTIAHLKKFLAQKYSVDVTRYNIDICHRRAPLPENWTLMDVAYIFAWKRNAPIRFFYRITQEEQSLEAPPNDRPSTPGLGASQPTTACDEAANAATAHGPEGAVVKKYEKAKKSIQKTGGELLARRSLPPPTIKANDAKSSSVPGLIKADEILKQVKSPIKILKNSNGLYQVMRGSSTPTRNISTSPTSLTPKSAPPPPPLPPPPTPAEFSVVSINDSTNSNGVKITLKQCPPGSTTSSSKKPKVISNVLLKNSNTKIGLSDQETLKYEKQKRKVSFSDIKHTNKPAENDKKQFLHEFRLTAKKAQEEQEPKEKVPETEDPTSVEAQVRMIIKSKINKELHNQLSPPNDSLKKRPGEVKLTSTNIADRINAKLLNSGENKASQISSSNDQPIDVYTFPSDPPSVSTASFTSTSVSASTTTTTATAAASSTTATTTSTTMTSTVPPGAVKRKCPPGLPIFDVRKKHEQYQAGGKKAGINITKTSPGAVAKSYKNQTAKSVVFTKPLTSFTNTTNSISSTANVNSSTVSSNPIVTSTSSKPPTQSFNFTDTRNLLGGHGINIPASLSITLTAPKSPSRGNDPPEQRGVKDHNPLDKLNPSITLNDKSVDPRVLKAIKSGQIKMPLANAKGNKGRQSTSDQGPAAKRKKDEAASQQQQQQQPKNALDLSGSKKMDFNPLRIPTPLGKFKSKPPNWSQANNRSSPKPPTNSDETTTSNSNGQVVTLIGGQQCYKAPAGSLTPAVHRVSDIPTPTGRAPVYAPCFSSPSPNSSRPAPNLSSVFPSLQSLYALSQAPSLEQFHMDSRMRMAAAAANAAKDNNPTNTTNSGGGGGGGGGGSGSGQVNKSHLAAQCAPVKPARSSVGSFAVPIAKPFLAKVTANNVAAKAPSAGDSNTTSSSSSTAKNSDTESSTTTEQKEKKNDCTKEVASKSEVDQSDNCASSTEETNSQPGSASPRVTSTASPSPPPSTNEAVEKKTSEKASVSSESEKSQATSGSEVTSSNNKSPESPDSSSVVTESNLVDSTKPNVEKNDKDECPVKSTETKSLNDEKNNAKLKEKIESTEFKKPMTSEAFQKRFLAAFPSTEWVNSSEAAEHIGNLLKSFSTMQAEAQSKKAKVVE